VQLWGTHFSGLRVVLFEAQEEYGKSRYILVRHFCDRRPHVMFFEASHESSARNPNATHLLAFPFFMLCNSSH